MVCCRDILAVVKKSIPTNHQLPQDTIRYISQMALQLRYTVTWRVLTVEEREDGQG